MYLQVLFTIFLTWQLCAARSVLVEKFEVEYTVYLTPEEAELLAQWTPDSNQNIWELSGQFEGDIVLAPDQRNGLIETNFRWSNGEIPYEIDPIFNEDQREWIIHSLTEYNNKTCIKPRLRNKNDQDYVYITGEQTGCHSMVGRRGGKQKINLQPNEPGVGCLRLGTVVHEFLHALGFYHQQSATNRDDYVNIIWENIKEDKTHNFNKYSEEVTTSFGAKYDYNSVMHYSAYAFSKNGDKTIVTLDSDAEIGQRNGLSEIDIIKLNSMYGCEGY